VGVTEQECEALARILEQQSYPYETVRFAVVVDAYGGGFQIAVEVIDSRLTSEPKLDLKLPSGWICGNWYWAEAAMTYCGAINRPQ